MTRAKPKTDAELTKFQADLLHLVREYKAGNLARKTVVAPKRLPGKK